LFQHKINPGQLSLAISVCEGEGNTKKLRVNKHTMRCTSLVGAFTVL